MTEWRTYRISDVADIFDGPHATPEKTTTGPWFLSIASLNDGRLDLNNSAHLSEEDFTRWTRRVTPHAGDVLFSYETKIGAAALMPDKIRACLGRRMALMRPNPDIVDPRFLLFSYLGDEFQDLIRRKTIHGATVDRISLTDLPSWPIRLPNLNEQRAISSFLGALDDKIAVNDRITDTSLTLAHLHYANTVANDAKVDQHRVSDVANVFDGPHATPKKTENGPWFLSISSLGHGLLNLNYSAHLSDEDFTHWTRRVTPQPGDVLFSYETRLGVASMMPSGVQACLGRRMALMRPIDDRIGPATLLHAYLADEFQETIRKNTIHGATVDRIPLTDLPSWKITLPPPEYRPIVEGALSALHHTIEARQQENRTLTELRDTLLPKLISGELRIKDAERHVTEVA